MNPASERKKRQRARERKGEIVAPVTVNNATIEALIVMRWLAEDESEDRKQIGCAIAALLDEFVSSPEFSVTRGQPNGCGCGLINGRSTNESES